MTVPRNNLGRFFASVVLVATVVLCLWLATYTEWHQAPMGPRTSQGLPGAFPSTPDWATPAAVVLGVGGGLVALLIFRPRHRAMKS
jgi:hypothetical protein